jgi:hypothetical protein
MLTAAHVAAITRTLNVLAWSYRLVVGRPLWCAICGSGMGEEET